MLLRSQTTIRMLRYVTHWSAARWHQTERILTMPLRSEAFVIDPVVANEAKGVDIKRSVGTDRMVYLDPILLVDHLHLPHTPGIGRLGFPRHPHRGIETFTIVLQGTMHHKDSIGNVSAIGPGGVQWMTAGRGIFHEEMMESHGLGVEVLQLWFNLPAAGKRAAPGYLGVSADTVPQIGPVRILAGTYQNTDGAAMGIACRPNVLDIALAGSESISIPVAEGHTAAAYLMSGNGIVTDHPSMVVFSDHGDEVELKSGPEGARWIFLSAPKLNEPIMQYRSFVMNSADDISETLKLIESGDFGT